MRCLLWTLIAVRVKSTYEINWKEKIAFISNIFSEVIGKNYPLPGLFLMGPLMIHSNQSSLLWRCRKGIKKQRKGKSHFCFKIKLILKSEKDNEWFIRTNSGLSEIVAHPSFWVDQLTGVPTMLFGYYQCQKPFFIGMNPLLLTVITVSASLFAVVLWFSGAEERAQGSESVWETEVSLIPCVDREFELKCVIRGLEWSIWPSEMRVHTSKEMRISLKVLEVCRRVVGWKLFINSHHCQIPMVFSCLF